MIIIRRDSVFHDGQPGLLWSINYLIVPDRQPSRLTRATLCVTRTDLQSLWPTIRIDIPFNNRSPLSAVHLYWLLRPRGPPPFIAIHDRLLCDPRRVVDSHYQIMRQLHIAVSTVSPTSRAERREIPRGNQADKHGSGWVMCCRA